MPERIANNLLEIKLIVLILLAWAARLALRSNLTVGLIMRQLVLSVLVGVIVAEYINDVALAGWKGTTLICVAVFLADDIFTMLLAFGSYAKDNQQTLFKRITAFLLGDK